MTTFTIDPDNSITVLAGASRSSEGGPLFTSEKELASISKDWPLARFTEIWNSFAGVAPFEDLKRAKKVTNRKTAIARIWNAAQRLSQDTEGTHSTQPLRRNSNRTRSEKRTRVNEARPKKDEVIGLMKRSRGATLAEIMAATGWQKHTVRGFVSILGSKGGQKVESSKNLAGERAYRIAK